LEECRAGLDDFSCGLAPGCQKTAKALAQDGFLRLRSTSMAGKEFENTPEKRNFSTEPEHRLSNHARMAVQAWAEKQPDKPSLSEAIERLVENGVTD
jgi:hypothetical protein